MKRSGKILLVRRLLLAASVLLPAMGWAADPAGTVLVASGNVRAVAADGSARVLSRNSPVYAGEKLVTGPIARVQVKFSDGSILSLKPGTELMVDQYAYEPRGVQAMFMSLTRGGFRTVTGAIGKLNKKDYRITTPVATIGVRGTLHEGAYDPETGLALAAWDGGTEACNARGCLELGAGADFRFGFVGLDGQLEGRLSPPRGVGDADDGSRGDASRPRAEGGGDGSEEGERLPGSLRDLASDDRGLFVRDPEQLVFGGFVPRNTGFVALGAPRGLAGEYPWGDERLLTIDGADAQLVSGDGFRVESWSIRSSTVGGFINPGNTLDGGFLPAVPRFRAVKTDEAWLVWGSWNGTDPVMGYGDVSIGDAAGVPTSDGVPAAGFYAFGSAVPAEAFTGLSGELTFALFRDPQNPSTSFPQFFDHTASFRQFASAADGTLIIDIGSGAVSGDLEFQSWSSGDLWHLELEGAIKSGQRIDLDVVVGEDGSTANGSWYQAVESSPRAVDGIVQASFVGAAQQLAVLGGFDVYTVDSADDAYATGLFLMDFQRADVTAELSGFAVLGGPAGGNSQGAESLLVLDQARLLIAQDADGNDVVLFGAMQSSTLGGKYILPGRLNPDLVSVTVPPEDPQFVTLPFDDATRIAWGHWLGNDMSVAVADDGYFTQDGIAEPGAFLFGDTASADAVARLTGTVSLDLLSQFPVFVDASGVPQSGQGVSGGMTVDVNTGFVSGNMAFATASSDQWNLAFNGTFSALAADNLALNVLTDAASPAAASHFVAAAGSGGALAVEGSLKASFLGKVDVAGVAGAFDVRTVDTADGNFARGVFSMAIPAVNVAN